MRKLATMTVVFVLAELSASYPRAGGSQNSDRALCHDAMLSKTPSRRTMP
jgi:hypothetical protein